MEFWRGLRPRELLFMRWDDKRPWYWPAVMAYDALSWVGWRGLAGPARHNWVFLRQWLARGRVTSFYWVPRVGDRVAACMSEGGARVTKVSIRKDTVWTEDGLKHSLWHCTSPYEELPGSTARG